MTLHLTGASGSGTSTLGQAVAQVLDLPWLDTDTYYWEPTDPPFEKARTPGERLARLEADLQDHRGWVLSGSLTGWGDVLIPRFDVVVFLYLVPGVRMARLEARENQRYGDRILPGGDRHGTSRDFLDWAARYDSAGPEIRSLCLHEGWLTNLSCPVLRLGGEELPEKVSAVLEFLKARGFPTPRG